MNVRYSNNVETNQKLVMVIMGKRFSNTNIKDYVAYLKTRGMTPTAFRCDQGTEFVNTDLVRWLREQGIELQTTAPYSPSQNGATERLNRTLVKLACAMMIAQNIPPFLWEYAIQHAAYLHEHAQQEPCWKKHPMRLGMVESQTSLTCTNLEHLFTFCCNHKRHDQS